MLFGYPNSTGQGFERRRFSDRSRTHFLRCNLRWRWKRPTISQKVWSLFEKLISEPAEIEESATWQSWIKILDSSLLGVHQSTFLGVAVIGNRLIGASADDSRLYLLIVMVSYAS